ncbi:MAG: hypothetical protein GQ574_09030 [Crocinitomix sp.]|nr:hypothetical protein [Crocinitomix sp.]
MKNGLVFILLVAVCSLNSCNKDEEEFVFKYAGEYTGEIIEHNEFGTGEINDTTKAAGALVEPLEEGASTHYIKNIGEVFSFDGKEIQDNIALETVVENDDTHYTYYYTVIFKEDSLFFDKRWESIGENGYAYFKGKR